MTCGRRMAIRMKAMLKRTERNTKGDACSKTFFTTTKVTPQISEQNVSDRSAFRRRRMGGRLRQVHVSVFAKTHRRTRGESSAPRKKQMRNRQTQARRLTQERSPRASNKSPESHFHCRGDSQLRFSPADRGGQQPRRIPRGKEVEPH